VRWVQAPALAPHRCAAVPFISGLNSTKGFIDTGSEMPGPGADHHIYVSVEAAEQMAQIIDWSPPAAVAALQELCGLQVQRIAQLEEQLAEANQVADAFDVVKRRKQRQKEAV
jgi:hypothetical protein